MLLSSNLLNQHFYLHVLNCNVLEPKRPTKKSYSQTSSVEGECKKAKRNTGQEKTTRKNKVVPSRKVKPPCEDKCRLHCKNKFTKTERQKIVE